MPKVHGQPYTNVRAGSIRAQVLELFQREYVGKVADPNHVRNEIMARIPGLSQANWSNMKPDLWNLLRGKPLPRMLAPLPKPSEPENGRHLPEAAPEHEEGQEPEFLIPSDLSDQGKLAFMALFNSRNEALASLASREAEMAALRRENATMAKRLALAKEVGKTLWDAL